MAVSAQYFEDFKKNYNIIVYQLLKEKLFISFGLELTATKINFCTNSDFPLVGSTYAYYNPIDDSLNINIEDPVFAKCTSEKQRITKLLFILFHEAYHKTLMHAERSNGKDHNLWNIAADYEVHNMLYLYSNISKADRNNTLKMYFEDISAMLAAWDNPKYKDDPKNGDYHCLFSTKLLENIAEEIYQMILNSKKVSETTYTLSLNGMMGGAGSSQMNANGSGNDGEESEESGNNGDKSDKDTDKNSDNDENGSDNGDNSDKSDKNEDSNGSGDKEGESEEDSKDSNGKDGKEKEDKNNKGQSQSNASVGNNSNSSSGPTVKVTKTTYILPDGREHTVTNIEWPDIKKDKAKEKEDKNNRELRKQLMEQEIRNAAERHKGDLSAKCEMFLKKLFKIKIDWEKILKASLQTILSKSDYFTWAKPRTSMFAMDMYLPAVCEDNQEYGTLIVARDESGSMSDEEVAKAGAIIADAKEHYKKIVVLKHDTEIQYEGEFENLDKDVIKMLCTRATCGGTSHEEVFKYIAEYNKKHAYEDDAISCVILMTDCCSDIQQTQKIVPSTIPMVYLVPQQALEYTKGIRGKIIPIEL